MYQNDLKHKKINKNIKFLYNTTPTTIQTLERGTRQM